MTEHISSHFNQELERVRSEALHMGGLVEQQLQLILSALHTGQTKGLHEVLTTESLINQLEVTIDDACQTIIARRQPAAGDLRFVLAVSRMIVDLERMGDELKKVAQSALELLTQNQISTQELYDTHRLTTMTVPMVQQALNAFARLDDKALLSISEADNLLDLDYRNQSRVLVTFMMEDPRRIGTLLEVMNMNRALERVGDHAKNIAEHVVYLVRGIDVRHVPLVDLKLD